jgi:sugar transferase (PEP-CTERM/EpsH1 system associated)
MSYRKRRRCCAALDQRVAPMRVFYLAQRVPYPPDRGDKIRSFHEVTHLARAHEVHVFCLGDGPEDIANVAGIRKYVESVTAVPRPNLQSKVRALVALAAGTPFSVGYFNVRELHRRIDEERRRLRPDVVVVYSSGMAQYAEPFGDVPRVMEFCDLDSLKWRQYAERHGPPLRWLYATEAQRLLNYERRIARGFDHSIVCTAREREDFERLIPGAPVSCVGNGVDLDYFAPSSAPKTPGRLVFTGVMDYMPNVDAVVWFSEQVLPAIRERVPEATFVICGSRPTARVQALASLPGVTVTGRVEDVRPYLAAAEVAVVPIRVARGIQNKLLEAMAMGLPCVSAAAARSGIEVTGESGLFVADEPDAFAARVVELLSDAELRARAGRAARAAVERHYSWSRQLTGLDAVLELVTAR